MGTCSQTRHVRVQKLRSGSEVRSRHPARKSKVSISPGRCCATETTCSCDGDSQPRLCSPCANLRTGAMLGLKSRGQRPAAHTPDLARHSKSSSLHGAQRGGTDSDTICQGDLASPGKQRSSFLTGAWQMGGGSFATPPKLRTASPGSLATWKSMLT